MDELSAYSFGALVGALRQKLRDAPFADERKSMCEACLDDLELWLDKPWLAECGKRNKQ